MLHPHDAGYVAFYKDVLDEIKQIRSNYDISDLDTSESIIEQYEFWVEGYLFDPEFDDDTLYAHTAQRVLSLFESELAK